MENPFMPTQLTPAQQASMERYNTIRTHADLKAEEARMDAGTQAAPHCYRCSNPDTAYTDTILDFCAPCATEMGINFPEHTIQHNADGSVVYP
jgi:hypothetical protein